MRGNPVTAPSAPAIRHEMKGFAKPGRSRQLTTWSVHDLISRALAGRFPPSLLSSVSDIGLLPPELAAHSLSTRDIVLSLADAERAIAHLSATGQRVETWEGWVRFPDGTRTQSLRHPGAFVLPADGARAAAATVDGMRKAQAAWERAPEYPGATLFFHLTVAPA